LRKYRFSETPPWKEILKVLHRQLDLRIYDAKRWKARNGSLSVLDRELLQTAYDNIRSLHLFLGQTKETKLEKTALNLLHQSEEIT